MSEPLFRPFRPFHSGCSTLFLHPLSILYSPSIPCFDSETTHHLAFFPRLYGCECQSELSGALQSDCSLLSCPVLVFAVYLSLCTSASPYYLLHLVRDLEYHTSKMSVSLCHRFLQTQVWKIFSKYPCLLFNPLFLIEDQVT